MNRTTALGVGLVMGALLLVAVAGLAAADISASLSGGGDALMTEGQDYTDTATFEATNDGDEAVTVEVSFITESESTASPSSDQFSLSPGETGTLDTTVTIDKDADPTWDDQTLTADYTVTENGSVIQDESTSVTYDVRHTNALTFKFDGPDGQLDLGQNVNIPIMGREVYGWFDLYDLEITRFECSASGVSGLDWTLDASLSVTHLDDWDPGEDMVQIGRLFGEVPEQLDAKNWGGTTVDCDVTISHQDGQVNKRATLDPLIPPTVEISEGSGGRASFIFDKPKKPGLKFRQDTTVKMKNWGDENWNGRPTIDFGDRSGVRFEITESASLRPRVTSFIDGTLVVPASHPETADGQGTWTTSASDLQVYEDSAIPYEVTYGAELDPLATRVDLRSVQVGVETTHELAVQETLDYTDVVVEPTQERSPGTDLELTLPDEVRIRAGQTAELPITFSAPAGTLPGCDLSWTITWHPKSNRPGLESFTTHVNATTEMAQIDEALASLDRLGIATDSEPAALLARAREGCDLSEDELETAAQVARASLVLDEPATDNGTAEAKLLEKAVGLRNIAPVMETNKSSLDPLQPVYQDRLEDLRAQARDRYRRLDEADPTFAALGSVGDLAVTYRALGMDPGPVEATQRRLQNSIEQEIDAGRNGLNELYTTPSRAPQGVTLARGVQMNPNPFGWTQVREMESQTAEYGTAAETAFSEFGPLEDHTKRAQARAQASLQTSQDALMAGTIFDGLIAVVFAGYGGRALLRYLRDVEDATLGSEIFG